MDKGWLEKAALDHTNGRHLIRLMDAVVVKLEGGSDDDIAVLEEGDIDDDETGGSSLDRSASSSIPSATSPVKTAAAEKREETKAAKETKKSTASDSGDEDNASETGEEKTESKKAKAVGDEDGALSDSDSEKGSEDEDDEKPESEKGSRRRKSSETVTPVPTIPGSGERKAMLLHKTASIFLRNISPLITTSEIETLCKRYPGFLRVSLADPLPERRFFRRGWVSFRRHVNIKEICWNFNNIRLRDTDLGAIVNRDLTRRVRTVNGITTHKQVAQNDLQLAARLVQVFDKKSKLWADVDTAATDNQDQEPKDSAFNGEMGYGIQSKNPLLHNITDYLIEEASAEEEELLGISGGIENEQKVVLERDDQLLKVLDRIILYLRVVHSLDYYNHCVYPHEDEMPNRCGLIHVRGPPPAPSAQGGQDEATGLPLIAVNFVDEFKKSSETKVKPLCNVDEQVTDADADKLGKKDPEKEVEAFITANCQELAKDKWLCPLSGKKFKGPEFVRKHLETKHAEKLEEVRMEVAYFNNYIYDSKRPGAMDPPKLLPHHPPSMVPHPPMDMPPMGMQPPPMQQPPPAQNFDYYNQPPNRPPAQMGGWNRGPQGDRQNYGGGGGGGYGNRGYGGRGFQQRDNFQRRDFGGQQRNFQRPPAGQWEGRRDPREPITYKDLDAPEDVY